MEHIIAAPRPHGLSSEAEASRLAALRRYDILDTPPDGTFDRVAEIASRLFGVPIAIVSLVDSHRVWFKARTGLDVDEVERAPGLCASAILQKDPWILSDAAMDPRSLSHPLVAGEFGLRFYCGVPLETADGHNIGTLCVIDRQPRDVTETEIANLRDLAALVIDQMELRLAARRAIDERETMLGELHHRVKNNLQILLSIIGASERRAAGDETRRTLRDLRGRVQAVGSAHEAMRSAASGATGETGALLEQICGAVAEAFGDTGVLETSIENHEVANRRLLPLALILNELLTNAFKHGLRGGEGRLRARFARCGDSLVLEVRDDGPGFPDAEGPERRSGMAFIRGLARQLRGELEVRNDGGAVCTLRFPAA